MQIENAVEDDEKSELLKAQILSLLDSFVTHWRNDSGIYSSSGYRQDQYSKAAWTLLGKSFPSDSVESETTSGSNAAALATVSLHYLMVRFNQMGISN